MGTQEEIFNKIGDLLQDLNGQYLTLSERDGLSEINELVLLEAKAQAAAAYITLLKTTTVLCEDPSKHTLNSAALESKKIAFNDYFTPPSTIRAAAQQFVAEQPAKVVQETEQVQDFKSLKDENLVEERERSVTYESGPLKSEESIPVADESVDSSITGSQVVEPPYQVEKEATSPMEEVNVFVKEVVEEPKEVIIEQPKEVLIQEEINTVVEEVPARPLTLNEIISQQKQAGVQNRVYQVNQSGSNDKLTDIKTGISLNDKLLFIKDLFNGYSLAYSEAIELLNRFTSYAEADAFLQTNYAIKNRWADKPNTVEKLYNVLRRRFS
ncbi:MULTISPECIES: hypothetical protein [unclassified Sphingobacterium]|uniref:hypothetical protein n=1 Tax=unclassified Sphingobacterium TaxID=2609468 RepID=UPI0025D47B85|nr:MULTISPECIES: hypothetical protein [unclassified Sphingobacterium]